MEYAGWMLDDRMAKDLKRKSLTTDYTDLKRGYEDDCCVKWQNRSYGSYGAC